MRRRKKDDKAALTDFVKEFRDRFEKGTLTRLDGRSALGKAMNDTRRALEAHVRKPSVVENVLIQETTFLILLSNTYQAYMMKQMREAGNVNDALPTSGILDSYRKISNLLRHNLILLGLKGSRVESDLWEYLKEKEKR